MVAQTPASCSRRPVPTRIRIFREPWGFPGSRDGRGSRARKRTRWRNRIGDAVTESAQRQLRQIGAEAYEPIRKCSR